MHSRVLLLQVLSKVGREISCLAEQLNLVTDSLYFIHIMRHLDTRVSLNHRFPVKRP